MAEYRAALTVLSEGPFLAIAVAAALLALLFELVPSRTTRYAGTLCLVVTTALTFVAAFESFESGALVTSHVASLLQTGSLDLSLGFAGDSVRLLVATLLSSAAGWVSFRNARAGKVGLRLRAAVALVAAGALVSLLAANLVVMLVGWELLALAVFLVTSLGTLQGASRALPWLGRAAQGALLASCAIIFWGWFGSFGPDGFYVADFLPRVASVRSDREARGDLSELTLTAWPGARVRLGGRVLPARAPFVRLPVAPGRYDLRITPGPGTDELTIDALALDSAVETRLVSTSATLDFEALRLRTKLNVADDAFVFERKRLFGLSAVNGVLCLASLALLLKASTALLVLPSTRGRAFTSRASGWLAIAALLAAAAAPLLSLRFLWSS